MAYSARHYARALHELTSSQTEEEQRETATRLFAKLQKEGRTGLLEEITAELARLDQSKEQNERVRIVTAHELSEAEQVQLQQQFPAASHEFAHDPELISGIVVEKNNSVFYATLAKASQQLRASIVR